jgi:hypothetical protein
VIKHNTLKTRDVPENLLLGLPVLDISAISFKIRLSLPYKRRLILMFTSQTEFEPILRTKQSQNSNNHGCTGVVLGSPILI